jgi:hypothetical protein
MEFRFRRQGVQSQFDLWLNRATAIADKWKSEKGVLLAESDSKQELRLQPVCACS